MTVENAAANLEGMLLQSGWEVVEKIQKDQYSTGAFFSVCYKVKKNNKIHFMKAFDFAKFFQTSEQTNVVDVLTEMLNAYKYEKDLSDLCKNRHVTKVLFVKEAGEENVEGYTIPTVPYLIFDLADGDVRKVLNFSDNLDLTWRLKSLHEIAVGLRQLHLIEVSHQDLKPSNILTIQGATRIADIGRSLCKSISSPFDKRPFTGDFNYAPPEIVYGYHLEDWKHRVFSTDCYLLGSMVVFYFTGVSMTALTQDKLPDQFKIRNWRGDFGELKPYLYSAFAVSVEEFGASIEDDFFRKELKKIVEYLCFPFPEKRGHPKDISGRGNSYSLERFISKLDLLYKKPFMV